jgi:hypothetical protein
VDQRVAGEVEAGTGRIIDDFQDVGGWPEFQGGEPPVDGRLLGDASRPRSDRFGPDPQTEEGLVPQQNAGSEDRGQEPAEEHQFPT